jgi:Ca2+-binding EF-hand superfamily protein
MKSSTIKTVILTFGAIVWMANDSLAQSQNKQERKEPPTFKELLKKMDENEDGKLSKSEIKGPLKDDFDKVDADEDGFITEEEFNDAPKHKRKERK